MSKTTKKITDYDTLTSVAKEVGVAKSTLDSAVRSGYVESAEMGLGNRVISIASARRWAASERKPGPKAKQPAGD